MSPAAVVGPVVEVAMPDLFGVTPLVTMVGVLLLLVALLFVTHR